MKSKNIFLFILVFIPLFGLCRPAGAASGITADVSAINFGGQAEGTVSDPQEIVLTNSANGDGVIEAIVIGGLHPAQFVVVEDFCSGSVLNFQESCSLSVAYAPTVEFPGGVGSAQADLLVNFMDPPALSIALDGDSITPNIVSSVTALDFGKKIAGQLSKPQTVTITNTGEADLAIGTARPSDGDTVDFAPSSDNCTFQTLPPGTSCTIELNMRPTELGDRFAEFTIESNDPDQPFLSIALSGVGTGSGGCSLETSGFPKGWLGVWMLFLMLPMIRVVFRLNS